MRQQAPRQRSRASLIAENRAVTCGFGGALGGTRTPNLLIRRSGQVVQDRPSPVVGWAGIPELSIRVGRRPAAWLQPWLQARRNGADPRPSAFQPGHITRCCMACWHPCALQIGEACSWLLPLQSRLLSTAAGRIEVSVTARTVQGMARVRSGQAPAWPLVSGRSVRRGSGVKREFACTFAQELSSRIRCPAATVTLETGGADTYTQRAIPGSEPRIGPWTLCTP